jgi:hypothetical protein
MGSARQYTITSGGSMNFTFTWILDKFNFQPKIETFDFPAPKETKAKKVAKKTVKKATTQPKK